MYQVSDNMMNNPDSQTFMSHGTMISGIYDCRGNNMPPQSIDEKVHEENYMSDDDEDCNVISEDENETGEKHTLQR